VSRVYGLLTERFGNPLALCEAPRQEVFDTAKALGLGNQRTTALQDLARYIVTNYAGMVPSDRVGLLSVPHVGDYVADATLLYAYGEIVLPLDESIRRVLKRVCGLPLDRTRPYSDTELLRIADTVTGQLSTTEEARAVHQALLWILWNVCKPRQPLCAVCPLNANCVTGSTRLRISCFDQAVHHSTDEEGHPRCRRGSIDSQQLW